MIRLGTVLLLVVMALTACGDGDGGKDGSGEGGSTPTAAGSESDWRAAVEERIGRAFTTDQEWHSYRDSVRSSCELNGDEAENWAFHIGLVIDDGGDAAHVADDVSYACPEHLELVEQQVAKAEETATE